MRKTTLAVHTSRCLICQHPERQEIERQFVSWTGPKKIAAAFKVSKDGIYRHASVTGLDEKRQQNIRAALCRIIEDADDVQVNAYAVVQVAAALSRINSRGQWVSRKEVVDLNQLFDRMSAAELDKHASTGELPEWFPTSADKPSASSFDTDTSDDEDGSDERTQPLVETR